MRILASSLPATQDQQQDLGADLAGLLQPQAGGEAAAAAAAPAGGGGGGAEYALGGDDFGMELEGGDDLYDPEDL